MEAKKQDNLAVFEWFKLYVIYSQLDPSIGHEELVSSKTFVFFTNIRCVQLLGLGSMQRL